MTDLNGWPSEARPGVPLNPERNGPHATEDHRGRYTLLWNAVERRWIDLFGNTERPISAARLRYLGPCHTPAEVATMLAAQATAMREACAQKACDLHSSPYYRSRDEVGAAIRALPLPDTTALAAMLAEAERRGMERATAIARTVIMEWQHYEDDTDADALAKDVAAAIRATMDQPA